VNKGEFPFNKGVWELETVFKPLGKERQKFLRGFSRMIM